MTDDPLHPVILDELMQMLSAEVPDYRTRELCCGQELARVDAMDDSLHMMRTKLMDITRENIDAIVVCCPACFMQFDQRQYVLQRQGEPYEIPVFYFTELIALSLGFSPDELFLKDHRIGVDAFLAQWGKNLEKQERAEETIDMDLLERCYQCGACINDCPTALMEDLFEPAEIMGLLREGKITEALDDGTFWLCVQCHTCTEMCPENIGMERFFEYLRREAIRRGNVPRSIKMGIDMFTKKAMLADIQKRVRSRYGLPDIPDTGAEDLLKLLKKDDED